LERGLQTELAQKATNRMKGRAAAAEGNMLHADDKAKPVNVGAYGTAEDFEGNEYGDGGDTKKRAKYEQDENEHDGIELGLDLLSDDGDDAEEDWGAVALEDDDGDSRVKAAAKDVPGPGGKAGGKAKGKRGKKAAEADVAPL
jgi:hypothetical protein